jgi:hypothetical protein
MATLTYKSDVHGTFTCEEYDFAEMVNTLLFRTNRPVSVDDLCEYLYETTGSDFSDVRTRFTCLIIMLSENIAFPADWLHNSGKDN